MLVIEFKGAAQRNIYEKSLPSLLLIE